MLLKEDSVATGAWLFRWRSYLPLVLIAVIIPAFEKFSYPFGSHAYDLTWELLCFTISLAGLAIRGYTIGYAPAGTSGRNTKSQRAETLNTTGIYSITRNPLYLGNFFMMLGASMFVRVWWVSLIYLLAFGLYYERIIMAEESFLEGQFGRQYANYARRTPAFVPRFSLWRPNVIPFSFRNVLKREYSGLFGLIAAFTTLELIGDYRIEGRVVWDPVWVVLFLFGLLTYIVLRTLKKKTHWLRVEGR